MAAKKLKKTVKKKVVISPEQLAKAREIRHLEVLIKYSLKAADSTSEVLRELFLAQASKIEARLEKFKEIT